MPSCFKWAGRAAIASHHVRLALFPLRLDADRTGYVNIPHSFVRPEDAPDGRCARDPGDDDTMLVTSFGPTFPTPAPEDGIELRALLRPEPH